MQELLTYIVLGVIAQVVLLIVFLVMASNVAKIKKFSKIQTERALFDSEYYIQLKTQIDQIEKPECQELVVDPNTSWVSFAEGEEKRGIYKEMGFYSCFLGGREVYFRSKEDAIKGLYLFLNRSK